MTARAKEIEELVDLMQRAAEKASPAVLALAGREEAARVIGRNPSGTLTRSIDRASEDALLSELKTSGIPLRVISEEGGVIELGEKPHWILVVDPLDGTTNALHGIPFFAVSLGLAEFTEAPTLKNLVAGVVRDVVRSVNYSAVKGRGPKSSGSILSEPSAGNEAKPLVSLYGYGVRALEGGNILRVMESSLVRTLGSVSLEMCMVASGSLDAFVDIRNLSRVVDVAAALVILRESGCPVSDAEGRELENPLADGRGLSVIAARTAALQRRLFEMVSSSKSRRD